MPPKFAANFHTDAADLQSAPIDISTAGVNEVIAATSSSDVIRVYRLVLIATVANNVTFLDGANSLSGAIPLATNQEIQFKFDTKPWLETSPGNNFNINLSAGNHLTGILYFTGGTIALAVSPTPANGYVTETGLVFYVAEDGLTFYVQEH